MAQLELLGCDSTRKCNYCTMVDVPSDGQGLGADSLLAKVKSLCCSYNKLGLIDPKLKWVTSLTINAYTQFA
jgi:hypothetical protein